MDQTINPSTTRLTRAVLVVAALLFPASSTVNAAGNCPLSRAPSTPSNVVELAATVPELSTLVAAVSAAQLAETLADADSITVFAPTNEAFAKLPAGTLEALLEPENRDHLQRLLSYHVVGESLTASAAGRRASAPTLAGPRVALRSAGSALKVDDARVIQADIDGVNAVVHLIDEVLIPPSEDLVSTAAATKQFQTLLAAAEAAGFAHELASGGPFTVFAPTDEAFAKLPAGTVEALLQPSEREHLRQLLRNHIVPKRVYADEAIAAQRVTNSAKQSLEFGLVNGSLRVNGVKVKDTDVQALNGVIHVVDEVLLLDANS